MTWLEEIIEAFEALGGDAPYSELYDYIESTTSRNLGPTWDATVRQTIEDNSSDAAFRQGRDIFYSVGGSGHWGLRSLQHAFDSIQAVDIEELSSLPGADTDESTAPPRVEIVQTRIIRETRLAKELKKWYNNACQVCLKRISLGERYYSEVHHLQPLGGQHKGPDILQNMIVLCPNHHAQFDYGALTIEPEGLQVVQADGRRLGQALVRTDLPLVLTFVSVPTMRPLGAACALQGPRG